MMQACLAGGRIWFLAFAMLLGAAGGAQAPSGEAQKLEFDVASVKQDKLNGEPYSNFSLDSGNMFSGVSATDVFAPESGYFVARNRSLFEYLNFAYKLTGTQMLALRFEQYAGPTVKMPGWVTADKFDIQARADGHPTKDQMRRMMQALLADRFQLRVHMETREVPVLALVAASAGHPATRLRTHPAADGCDGPASLGADQLPAACGVIAHLAPSGPGLARFGGRGVTLSLLASSLPTQTGLALVRRPVIDRTGLGGTVDFVLEWALDAGGNGESTASGPTFATALRDQLGFGLEEGKGPVELLVIDHVEHPSAN